MTPYDRRASLYQPEFSYAFASEYFEDANDRCPNENPATKKQTDASKAMRICFNFI